MIQEVLNHLWQSTLLVGVIALLTWLFRGHGAQVRYGLWFAASCKFLLPFSLLIFLGGHFHWRLTNSPTAAPMLSRVVAPFATSEAIVSPGTNRTTPAITAQTLTAASPVGAAAAASRSLPWLALGLWACGCAFVLGRWIMRWRRIQRAVNESAALPIAAPVPVRASAATLEPGVIGIWRPILLLPMGIEARLTPPQLHSIILHEIAHVRRRDNLTAALHMLVEVLFWFYPLVWWVGAQLIRERESACDEAPLASGCSPQVYAEGILNVCKYYMQLSVACAAGVAGANLKKRIESIMAPRQLRRLTAAGAVVISSAAVLTLLIRTNMQLGDQAAVRTLLDAALKHDAHALSPRRAYMRSIQTRFGGSLQQMIDFVQSSRAAGLTPGQLAVLQQFVDDEHKWREARSGLPNEGAVASN